MLKQEYAGADEDSSSAEVSEWVNPHSPRIDSALKSPSLVDSADSLNGSLFL